ncbi:hypothetical protein BABINDRAFT_161511 [Babjeviella inositovora NRRL Y-12698]|uniref:Exocyst complex component Sec3 PIP2-binding N-terminal domain-containing protein n=1 Tax=Babjeviella inositovora NRRL Y-12698 TaxID=984486 RepID=A0A1E3QQ47_9ASCO|nr:uncharacterized protein BABINDRAFT_161511 [Babjeviella inositovora NRRL Y-12698]ODQ79823.1 hypothetical protein BABINDRAFT_161511 [Babjeviella inositovora NRRL Y-12698]
MLSPSQMSRRLKGIGKKSSPSSPIQNLLLNESPTLNQAPSADLARQYETDKASLIKYCFSGRDGLGNLHESYITHVRIIEDSHYPYDVPPATSAAKNKKQRVLVLGVKKSGRVHIHKGRQNDDGTFQIGRTWDLEELKQITKLDSFSGFQMTIGKTYYWETNSPLERMVFCKTIIQNYMKYTGGRIPELKGWDLATFHLETLRPGTAEKSVDKGKYVVLGSTAPVREPTVRRAKEEVQLKKKPTQPGSPKTPGALYGGIDFTVNGTLPMKPMVEMIVDRTPGRVETDVKQRSKSERSTLDGKSRSMLDAGKPRSMLDAGKPRSMLDAGKPERGMVTGNTGRSLFGLNERPDPRTSRSMLDPGEPGRVSAPSIDKLGNTSGALINSSLASQLLRRASPSYPERNAARLQSKESTTPTSVSLHLRESAPNHPFRGLSATSSPVYTRGNAVIDKENETSYYEPHSFMEEKALNLRREIGVLEPAIEVNPISFKTVAPVSMEPALDNSFGGLLPTLSEKEMIEREIMELLPGSDTEEISRPDPKPVYGEPVPGFGKEPKEVLNGKGLHASLNNASAPLNEDFDLNASLDNDDYSKTSLSTKELPPLGKDVDLNSAEDGDLQASLQGGALGNGTLGVTSEALDVPQNSLALEEYQPDTNNELEDILDMVNWNMNDSSDELIKKLQNQINSMKYHSANDLLGMNLDLKKLDNYVDLVIGEVDNLGAYFKNFQIDLKMIEHDIHAIENESQGLQVETINKKVLYAELKEILEKVTIKEQDMKVLQRADFAHELQDIELTLVAFYSALQTVVFSKEKLDLSDMKALKQHRETFEGITRDFSQSVKLFLEGRIKSLVKRITSHENAITIADLLSYFSRLLKYSAILLFVKEIAPEVYSALLAYFETSIAPFYNALLGEKIAWIQTSMDMSVKDIPVTVEASRTKSIKFNENKLKEKLGLAEVSHFSGSKRVSAVPSTAKVGTDPTSTIIAFIEEFRDLIITQQDFQLKFFHLSSASGEYPEYIEDNPIDRRKEMLDRPFFLIEANRQFAATLFNSMNNLFNEHMHTFLKIASPPVSSLPALLLTTERIQKKYEQTNQEFLSKFLYRLAEKFKITWLKAVNEKMKGLAKVTFGKRSGVSPIIKEFLQFVDSTEHALMSVLSLDPAASSDSPTRAMLDHSYLELGESIKNALVKANPSQDTHHSNKERTHAMINMIINLNYLVDESGTHDNESLLTMQSEFNQLLQRETVEYIDSIMAIPFGKLIEFVESIESLTKDSIAINLSKSSVYNKAATKKLLASFDLKELRLKIEMLHKKLEKHFIVENSEFENRVRDRIWLSLQNQCISTFKRLNFILSRYYGEVEYGVSKEAIISEFRVYTK